MTEPSTIARPYAEAVFRLAAAAGKLADWSTMLKALAQVAANEQVQGVLSDPTLPAAKRAGLFTEILVGGLTGECENFVRLLAERERLTLLPEIRSQFETLKNEHDGVVEAEIQTAMELDPVQLGELVARLESHTGRKVHVLVSVNPALIAGVRVLIGDKVIDASARAQLSALAQALKA